MKVEPVRRRLLAAAVLSLAASPVLAQGWPARPVTMIVPTGAGSAPDIIARLLAERLGALWGQTVIVDNKPGAGGIPGMAAVSRSKNDGYTIGFAPAAMTTITPLVYKTPQFNPDTDLLPVATVAISPLLLVTNASNGIQTLADLAQRSKSQPGKLNLAAPQCTRCRTWLPRWSARPAAWACTRCRTRPAGGGDRRHRR